MSQTRMNLAARSFDLLSTLIKASEPASTIVKYTQDLTKWLARECVDEMSFKKCLELAHGLAYPNEVGYEIRRLIEGDQRLQGLKNVPHGLIVSGSLSRMMVRDIDFCYMVSTTAVLADFYSPAEVTGILCSMMLDAGNHEHRTSYRYQAQCEPIKAVVSKIVDSIFINVVNTGHRLKGMPDDLHRLHAHTVQAQVLAGVIMSIQRTQENILLSSESFIGHVASWLLCHFDGFLEISVGNKILFSKQLGPNSRTIRMLVKQDCKKSICSRKEGSIELSSAVSDNKHHTLIKIDAAAPDPSVVPQAHQRQSLEEVGINTRLQRVEKYNIFHAAKHILSWLLDRPLKPLHASDLQLGFRVMLDHDNSLLKVRDILISHPSLLRGENNVKQQVASAFRDVPESSTIALTDDEHSEPKSESRDPILTLSGILHCFPIAEDSIENIQQRCGCFVCKTQGSLDDSKAGCLRRLAVEELFLLLAYGISDGFGAKDISRLAKPVDVVTLMVKLLYVLLRHKTIHWDNWFAVFACTALGIPSNSFDLSNTHWRKTNEQGETSLVAAQNDGYVAIARWARMQQELNVKGCFGVEIFEGRLSGVSEELALLRCERTMVSLTIEDQVARTDLVTEDRTEAEVNTAIFRLSPARYRLMTFVKTATHLRIVDPTQALLGLVRAAFPKCAHAGVAPDEQALDGLALRGWAPRVCKFEDILEHWDSHLAPNEVIEINHLFDDHLKLNVVMALSSSELVIQDPSSCVRCAILMASGLNIHPVRVIRLKKSSVKFIHWF
ncbi:MAG: hypothetical protein M1821_009251 [Bathelium mastoideum]|nr:MAG: hypothetical protein M1821_009251 [Bathelium mastoideum]